MPNVKITRVISAHAFEQWRGSIEVAGAVIFSAVRWSEHGARQALRDELFRLKYTF